MGKSINEEVDFIERRTEELSTFYSRERLINLIIMYEICIDEFSKDNTIRRHEEIIHNMRNVDAIKNALLNNQSEKTSFVLRQFAEISDGDYSTEFKYNARHELYSIIKGAKYIL